MGAGSVWELSVPSPQFFCGPQTALKNKVYLKKKKTQNLKTENKQVLFLPWHIFLCRVWNDCFWSFLLFPSKTLQLSLEQHREGKLGAPTLCAVKNLRITLWSALLRIRGFNWLQIVQYRNTYWKNSACKWIIAFQTHVIQGPTASSVFLLLLYLRSRKQWSLIIFFSGPL